ncbi:MAG: M23 family metallopeptidase [Acidimicrobiales bacterium]
MGRRAAALHHPVRPDRPDAQLRAGQAASRRPARRPAGHGGPPAPVRRPVVDQRGAHARDRRPPPRRSEPAPLLRLRHLARRRHLPGHRRRQRGLLVLGTAGARPRRRSGGVGAGRRGGQPSGGGDNTAQPIGNSVVLDLGDGQYAVLAHLQKGSVRVAKGDTVGAGDVLGLCGSSGNSSEPHVHFHVQDKPSFSAAGVVGIPVRFQAFEADGSGQTTGAPPVSGQFVAHSRS